MKASKKIFSISALIIFTACLLLFSQNAFAASVQYKVKSGDTLSLIASKYGIATTDIIKTNNLSTTNLYVGQSLNLTIMPNYTVKSGDTLYLISLKYNTAIQDLIDYNSLKTTSLYIGQTLRVVPPDPTVSLRSGTYVGEQTLQLQNNISTLLTYYTLDDTNPTNISSLYSSPITISKSATLKLVSIKNNNYSNTVESSYIINFPPSAPNSSIESGTYIGGQNITLASNTGEIYYTLDGSVPNNASTKYYSSILLLNNTTLKAVAYDSSTNLYSPVKEYNYIINKPSSPISNTPSGYYKDIISVNLSSSDAEKMLYTIDSSDPKLNGIHYTSSILIDKNMMLRVVSVKNGLYSDEKLYNFEINLKPLSPTTNISSGIYYATQSLILSSDGSDIYFTTDGSVPTKLSSKYTAPIILNTHSSLKAIAVNKYNYSSDVVTFEYKVYIRQFVNYTVILNDTIDTIANKFYTTAAEIIRLNNMSTSTVSVGQILKIYSYKYTVLSGDTLASIAEKNNSDPDSIISVNKMYSDIIYVGQPIRLPQWGVRAVVQSNKGLTIAKVSTCPPNRLPPPYVTSRPEYNISFAAQAEEDLYWLSKIINAEAAGEIYDGQVAVGNVVMNRAKYYNFKLKDVVFESVAGYIQFEPVINGSIFNTPSTSAKNAAADAYKGIKPAGESLYFLNPLTAQSSWITKNRVFYIRIGNHDFYL